MSTLKKETMAPYIGNPIVGFWDNISNNDIDMYLDWAELSHTKVGNNWVTEISWSIYLVSEQYGNIISNTKKNWSLKALSYTDTNIAPTVTPKEGSTYISISSNSKVELASGTAKITRSSDEAATNYDVDFIFELPFDITYNGERYYYSSFDFTFKLSAILDEATIATCANFTDTGEISLTYNLGAGVTKLEVCISGDKPIYYYTTPPEDQWSSWVDIPLSSNGSFSAVVSSTFAAFLRSGPLSKVTSATCYYYLKSYFADGSVVYDAKAARVSLATTDINLVADVYDINPATLAITGNKNIFIKYMSNAEYVLNATPVPAGASLVSCYVQHGNYKGEPPTGVINGVENGSFYFYAKDSRGIIKTKEIERDVYDYVKLTCNASATTELSGDLGTGATVRLTMNGNYFNGTFGGKKNELKIWVKHTQPDGSMGDWVDLSPLLYETDGNTFTFGTTITGLTYEIPYTFKCKCADKLMEVESEEFTIRVLPVFDWGNNDFNFNATVNMYKTPVLRFNRDTGNIVLSGGEEGKIYLRPTGTDVTDNEVIIHENGNVDVSGNLDAAGLTVNGVPVTTPANYLMESGTEAMGTNGTWYWEKWSNGKAVCWGTRNFGSWNISGSTGNYKTPSSFKQSFPLGLFAYPPDCVQMTLGLNGSTYTPWIALQGTENHTASQTAPFVICNTMSGQLGSTHVAFHAIGRWK